MSFHSWYHEQITGMITHAEHFHLPVLQYDTEAQGVLSWAFLVQKGLRDSTASRLSTHSLYLGSFLPGISQPCSWSQALCPAQCLLWGLAVAAIRNVYLMCHWGLWVVSTLSKQSGPSSLACSSLWDGAVTLSSLLFSFRCRTAPSRSVCN